MGACISRPLLTSLEDLLFSLGSLYSYLYSHLTTLLNRFYSLLLSPLFRVEEHIPSQLCDGTTGVCIRPKDRVKQSRRKVEMRMRRAELAAKGLDPGLATALKRKDSRTSNAEVVAARDNEKIMKRWSRADSIVTTTALDEKTPAVAAVAASAPNTTRVRRSTDADRRLRRSIDIAAPHASSTDRPIVKASSVDTAPVSLNPPTRTRTTPIPGMGSRPSPRTPTSVAAVAPVPRRVSNANSKPPTAYVALEHAVVPAREAQPTAKLKSRQRLTSLQLEAGGEGKLRQTPKATSYAAPKATPAAGTNQAAGVTKGSAGGVGAPLTSNDVARAAEKLVLARQSIDAQRAMPGYITSPPSRTSTPPPAFTSLSTTTTHQSQASTGGNGNGNEPSPRGSISDLAAAACNARGNKKERKLWRDEVEKVAKSRVGGSGAVVKG